MNKPKTLKETEVLASTKEVWEYLKAETGLDVKKYDADLINCIKSNLSIPANSDLEYFIQTKNIKLEDFIIAFFKATQPYAEMMSDILKMFEKAGAIQTNSNLLIEFDFSDKIPMLKFDLKHFRKWVQTWTMILDDYLANLWSYHSIWQLNSIVRVNNKIINNPLINKWLDEYNQLKIWPDFFLDCPKSGNQPLDEALLKVWNVWETVVKKSMRFGKDRDNLRQLAISEHDNQDSPEEEFSKCWTPHFLWLIDSDYWAGSLVNGIFYKVEEYDGLPSSKKQIYADNLTKKINNLFNQIPKNKILTKKYIQNLIEVINLPIWKYRHELYSVWIGTQILDSLDDYGPRIHQVNGTIVYSFSGTHIATFDAFTPKLHLWAELRSNMKNPIGKGRKKAIQPDYTLITDPITNPEASILEVECKQYLKPSTINFSNALSDYANGRPNAQVILVNYGPAKQTILDKVDISIRHRTHLIGEMRPGLITARNIFQQSIRDFVEDKMISSQVDKLKTQEITNFPEIGKISLSWQNKPRDLDIHLYIITNNGDNKEINNIFYGNEGSLTQFPWAKLDEDVQTGFGPETIEIAKWLEGSYHFFVHNYSNDISLKECSASINFTINNQIFLLHCPANGEGSWWYLFRINTLTSTNEIVNKIVENPSF